MWLSRSDRMREEEEEEEEEKALISPLEGLLPGASLGSLEFYRTTLR